MALDLLIVDDEQDIRDLISGILSDEGYETRTAHDSESALMEIEARCPSLLILDIWLQGSKRDGLEILELVKTSHKDMPVIMISGHGNIETAVAAIKLGACDFIEKPFQMEHLLHIVARATESERLKRENRELKKRAGMVTELTGRSSAINLLRQQIDKVAPTNSRVLISGPAGSGKEVVARLLHDHSGRANGNFVVVNSATILPDRMEHELFGVEQNGKVVKTGLFEQAHGGTLFLDEVTDMPRDTQAKILRVLTDQTFQRVGGNKKVQVDVRVFSATGQDINQFVNENRFRADLFHRLNVVPLDVPPLSDRREDIPLLIEKFVEVIADGYGLARLSVGAEAIALLQAYDWPGNVRQLRNVVERILILGRGETEREVTPSMLPPEIVRDQDELAVPESRKLIMAAPLREAREAFEREYLKVQIMRFSGNISRTAVFIGMERSALHRKMKSLGIASDGRIRAVRH